jgi:hypothetical protein
VSSSIGESNITQYHRRHCSLFLTEFDKASPRPEQTTQQGKLMNTTQSTSSGRSHHHIKHTWLSKKKGIVRCLIGSLFWCLLFFCSLLTSAENKNTASTNQQRSSFLGMRIPRQNHTHIHTFIVCACNVEKD